jgi:8-oxo-dGTP pyrophosphatase MutT (NUDIX family)
MTETWVGQAELSADWLNIDGPNPWRTVSTRIVYDNSRLCLKEDQVIQPDGEPGSYVYLEFPWPVVAIVPVDEDRHVYLVRQWRYPWERNSWEIPAGHGEPWETPFEAAQRELAEEVGLEASEWEPLGEGYSSATLNARYHLYLARGLSPARRSPTRDGAESDMIARRVPMAEAVEAAMIGRIEHGMSVVGLLRAARRLGL